MAPESDLIDLYEARRKEFTELLLQHLPSPLGAANMFDSIDARKISLTRIGFTTPDLFVQPNETAAVFQDRLIWELGSKLLVEPTSKLLDRLNEFHVRATNFPELDTVRAKCCELLNELETRASGKLDADTGLAPAKYLVEFEYGIRQEAWGKQKLSDRDELYDELKDWADQKRFQDRQVFCIEADGGLGKSMLAWNWFQDYYNMHKTDGRYDAYVWWSFYGHDAGFEHFLDWALKGLGAGGNFESQEPLLNRVRRLNRMLKEGGVLMVLDGVERLSVAYLDPQEREALKSIGTSGRQSPYRSSREFTDQDLADEDIEEFFDEIRGAERSRILTTSRVVLGPFAKRSRKEQKGVLLRKLEPLEPDYCIHLWRQINPNEVQWNQVRRLCEDVGRNTLLIRVLASAVAVTAGGLLDNWPKDDVSQELLTTAPVKEARSRLLKYALDRISRPAWLALKTLCAFPSPMKRELALKLVGDSQIVPSHEEPESVFNELASCALIGVVKNDGIVSAYDIHPIVRDHVRLAEVYRDPEDLAILDNIYEAIPDPGANRVRDVQDLNWAIIQFQRAVDHDLYLNAWQVFRDRLETPLMFLGADYEMGRLLRSLFPEQRLSSLPLVASDRAAQAEILRLVAIIADRLNLDVDTDRLWRWCLALQFLTQDASRWINSLDSRISLSVYGGRLAQCQEDIVLALSLARDFNLPGRKFSLYCFLGISLAFQGDKLRSMKAFEMADEALSAVDESERTTSRRWVLQGRAEALVWLGDAAGATAAVKRMGHEGNSQEVSWGQRAWEEWTAGAAALMAGDDSQSAATHLMKAFNIAERQHYFLVMLLSLASRVRLALQSGEHDEAKLYVKRIQECDPHKRCFPAQVLVNLVQAETASKVTKPAEVIPFASEAYRLSVEFQLFRAGVDQARNLLPTTLRNAYPDVQVAPKPEVLTLLDRNELPTVTAGGAATWWESNTGISARSRELADLSTDEITARISERRSELQPDQTDAVCNWSAQIVDAFSPGDQLLILDFVRYSGLPIEQIAKRRQAEPIRLASVVGYCARLRTLGVLCDCEYQGSQVFKDLSIEERRQWIESLTVGSVSPGLRDYQLKPGVAFDRVQFDRAIDILILEDYPVFVDDFRRKCLPATDPDAAAWWTVLTIQLPARDVLYFAEELVSLKLTVAGFLEGLEIDNPRNCRARLAAVYSEQLHAFGGVSITNTLGWSDEQIGARLEEVKRLLDWTNTTGSALTWWKAFESENKTRMPLVLQTAEELAVRKATITEFFLAYVYSNTDNILANLHYLDYTRLKKEVDQKKKEEQAARLLVAASRATADSPPPAPLVLDRWAGWAPDRLASGFSDTAGWSEERLQVRLEEVKELLDWANTKPSARKWWTDLESEARGKLNLVVRLAEELSVVSKATIDEFFSAYAYSNTDNIQANLYYLNYTRLKKREEEDKKKKEAASRALQTPSLSTEPERAVKELTELTFVRCSSCKSLVPANATKCRMCGTPLLPLAGASESQQGDPT